MSATRKRLSFAAVGMLLISLHGLGGCERESRAERIRLEAENHELESRLHAMQARLDSIRTAPESRYADAIRAREAGELAEAQSLFRSLWEEFPTHSLAMHARKEGADLEKLIRTETARREEEQKYQPRSQAEAIQEWRAFRNNEDALRGKITTWRFEVSYISDVCECPVGHLDVLDYSVAVHGPEGWTYQAAAMVGKVPQVRKGDWIVVTGRFETISSDNFVIFSPVRIKNEGFRD